MQGDSTGKFLYHSAGLPACDLQYSAHKEEYRNYLETDFDDVDLKELKDIRKIRIDRNQTKEKRIAQYLRQVGNPYLVCIGNVKVKIRFANNGVSFEDAFEELLLSV